LKIGKKWLWTAFLAILLLSLTAPLLAQPISASDIDDAKEELELEDLDHWKMLKTPIITVLFPRDGRKPMFLWWNTSDPYMIYVVKYQGLIEYFTFDKLGIHPEYYMRPREALFEKLRELYFKEWEEDYELMDAWINLWQLRQLIGQINATWHRPYLPFNAGNWTLTEPEYIRSEDGTVIGVAFAFKLERLPDWMPHLQFAEGNIMIKLRFYNATVSETVPNTDIRYTVNPGEMKMDFVVNKWVWNIDAIRPLIINLREEHGIEIPEEIPEGKARLALWVNLASINLTKLEKAEAEPEEIEHVSTASHIEVEGEPETVSIVNNETSTETPETPILIEKPAIRLGFATSEKTLKGFFKFVSSAKVNRTIDGTKTVTTLPVKASYIAAGFHMRLFIGYPYFGNGTLEHDPSIGVDVKGVDTTPQYQVQVPSGNQITPVVVGKITLPLVTLELAVVLVGVTSVIAAIIYAAKWRKKTINMVGVGAG